MNVGSSTEGPALVGETTGRADKRKEVRMVGWALRG